MESDSFDGAFKKKAPAAGRRRRQPLPDEDPDSSVPTNKTDDPPPKGMSAFSDSPQRDSADGDGGKPAGRRGRRQMAAEEQMEEQPDTPERQQIGSMDDDDDDGMNFIPDLEDEEADLGSKVAVAPSLKSSRVQTIAELDAAIDMALPSSESVGGIDLSVLQAYLTPQEQVQEEDVPWDVEHELQMIASEMQKEAEERDGSTMPGHASPQSKKTKSAAGASSSLA